jgi:Xaa-Pro aminopeptidase
MAEESMQQRLQQVREQLRERELDALLVTSAPNRRYLSGFTGSAGVLLVSADRALLLSDFRYQAQAAQEAVGCEFHLLPSNAGGAAAWGQALPPIVRERGVRRLGFEAESLTVAQYSTLQDAFADQQVAVEWIAGDGLVEQLRQIKNADEIAILRRAIAITDEAFAEVRPLLRPTMREREAAWELEKAMRERGADGIAFPIIVAAGDNGSRPHARAGNDELGVGRPIVMDFGALLDGYHADMTRTVILGHADDRFWSIYNTVLEAQQAAENTIRAGLSGKQADTIARDVIAAAGHGDAFGHSLGHGVGLVIHEGPRLSQTSDDVLRPGAIFSVEPGIYLPGWGGVRIEDLALVTETGLDVVTESTKEPLIEV